MTMKYAKEQLNYLSKPNLEKTINQLSDIYYQNNLIDNIARLRGSGWKKDRIVVINKCIL